MNKYFNSDQLSFYTIYASKIANSFLVSSPIVIIKINYFNE